MIATQRTDGQFVDVRTDERTVSFKRPTLALYSEFTNKVCAGRQAKGALEFLIGCAENKAAAELLLEEWPGALSTVCAALVEMVTPKPGKRQA